MVPTCTYIRHIYTGEQKTRLAENPFDQPFKTIEVGVLEVMPRRLKANICALR
jgi:hypothetical protein